MMFRMIGMVILSMHSVNCEFKIVFANKINGSRIILAAKIYYASSTIVFLIVISADTFL